MQSAPFDIRKKCLQPDSYKTDGVSSETRFPYPLYPVDHFVFRPESALDSQQSGVNDCLQVEFHAVHRNLLLVLYPKDIFIFDLVINQTVGHVPLDRTTGLFSQVITWASSKSIQNERLTRHRSRFALAPEPTTSTASTTIAHSACASASPTRVAPTTSHMKP